MARGAFEETSKEDAQWNIFPNVPVEVLFAILADLKNNPQDMAALSLTCKHLNELVQPLMYSHIRLSHQAMPFFVRTILRAPRLISHVARLEMYEPGAQPRLNASADLYYGAPRVQDDYLQQQWPDLQTQLTNYLQRTFKVQEDRISEGGIFPPAIGQTDWAILRLTSKFDWEAVASCLLVLLSTTETLDIGHDRSTLHDFLEMFFLLPNPRAQEELTTSKDSALAFRNLKHVNITSSSYLTYLSGRVSVIDILPVLKLPTLQSFSCVLLTDNEDDDDEDEELDSYTGTIDVIPSLESLELLDCNANSTILSRIFIQCKSLKNLRLEHAPKHSNAGLNFAKIIKSLLHLRASLETLIIKEDDEEFLNSGLENSTDEAMISLRPFTKLQKLDIHADYIRCPVLSTTPDGPTNPWEFRELPPRLSEFCVHNAKEEDIAELIKSNLGNLKSLLSLRSIKIGLICILGGPNTSFWWCISRACWRRNVKLSLTWRDSMSGKEEKFEVDHGNDLETDSDDEDPDFNDYGDLLSSLSSQQDPDALPAHARWNMR